MPMNWKENYWIRNIDFRTGDIVRILPSDEKARMGGWGDKWNPKMEKTVGQIGVITRITLCNGDIFENRREFIPVEKIRKVRVEFDELERYNGENYWSYPPWMLIKHKGDVLELK